MLRLVILTLCTICAFGITRDQMYPYDTSRGDTRLGLGDDISSDAIRLDVPVAFYDEIFDSIYININGFLSFEEPLSAFKKGFVLPINLRMIAAFVSDIDTSLTGNVYYRETQDPSLLEMASRDIQRYFPNGRRFRPRALFIVTWDNVGFFNKNYDESNTFQIVIASDGVDSYVFLLYPDDGINWITSDGKYADEPDLPAQAGFDAGDGRRYTMIPGSGRPDVRNLNEWSNVNQKGKWIFRVGDTNGGSVEDAGNVKEEVAPGDRPASTCSAGGRETCNANANCVDYSSGFCCECGQGFIGNGRNCLQIGEAKRVNGKVTGTLNGIKLEDLDMHVYIVTSDGRSYTAISMPLGQPAGPAMQLAFALAEPFGWQFARPATPEAKNGFQITGGDVNRTATIRFNSAREEVTLRQQFIGQDDLGYMRVNTQINGNIPSIAEGSKVTVPDHNIEYSRTAPGVIKSSQNQQYSIDEVPYSFKIDQTYEYKECPHKPAPGVNSQRLASSRNYIVYAVETDMQIVRFASTNKIQPVAGSGGNPCERQGLRCDRNAECVPSGAEFTCMCRDGYRGDGQRCVAERTCADIQCDRNARCDDRREEPVCLCNPGYSGNGFTCTADRRTCEDVRCDDNARCRYDERTREPICVCNPGYEGDGSRCSRVEFSCNEVNNCGENAECVWNGEKYECECSDGFSGDGFSCSETGEPEINCKFCDRYAECIYDVDRLIYRCQCREGFSGDGNTCSRIDELSCNDINNCHASADCRYDDRNDRYLCVCKYGFVGDGYYCEEAGCDAVDNCDPNAQCLYQASLDKYQCVCNDGYQGSGLRCERVGTDDCRRNPDLCDNNARCSFDYDNRRYFCECNEGFEGNGQTCREEAQGDRSTYLMYTQGKSIMSIPFQPTSDNNGKQVLYVPGQTAVGIDVDCYSRYFYWTDVTGKGISKAKLDGTDSQVIVQNLGSPEGVAVDWVARNIYWTDSGLDRIEVSRLDGTHRKALFDTGLVNPRGIVVDPARGYLFWSDWNRDEPKIERSNLDGTDRMVLVKDNVGLPNGLTLDYEQERLCWADAKTQHIECVRYDGRGRRSIYGLADRPFALALARSVFYWTDWNMKSIPNINAYGTSTNEALILPPGGNGRLYGIAAVKEECPRGGNACALNNGGCRFLCLPTPNGGRSCACPDDIDQDECNRIGVLL